MSKSTILSILGGVGVVMTGALAARAGAKMVKENKRIDLKDLNTVKEAAPILLPPVIVGAATIVDIAITHKVNTGIVAGVAAGGLATAEILRRTQDEVKKLVGVDKYNEITEKVAKSIAEGVKSIPQKPLLIAAPEVKDDPSRMPKQFILALGYTGNEDGDPAELGIKFVSTDYDVLMAEYQLNRLYASNDEASLADFMDMLPKEVSSKIEPIHHSYGWDYEYLCDFTEDRWIDFSHVKTKLDGDPTEYTVICCTECPPVYRESLEKHWNGV